MSDEEIAALEAQVKQKRGDLADTVDALAAKSTQVKARAGHTALWGSGAVAALVIGLVVVRQVRRARG